MCWKLTLPPLFVCRTLFPPPVYQDPIYTDYVLYIYTHLWYRRLVDTRGGQCFIIMLLFTSIILCFWVDLIAKSDVLPQNLQNLTIYRINFATYQCRKSNNLKNKQLLSNFVRWNFRSYGANPPPFRNGCLWNSFSGFSTPSLLASTYFGTFWSLFFNFLNYIVWLGILDEGSVPEMRIWSISLI